MMTGEAPSPQLELYYRFTQACTKADVATMRDCVDIDAFFAVTPGQGRTTFEDFALLQQRLFSVTMPSSFRARPLKVVEQGDTVVVKYYMVFTLTDSGKRVETTAIDMVTFGGGKIAELFVAYDRASTREQAFGNIDIV